MAETLKVGVIGLGVVGQRMLGRLAAQQRLEAVAVWDTDPAAIARALAAYPALHATTSAEELIAHPGLDTVYIATPPGPHMPLSELAFDAGLAVFCEKPLTVDFDAARHCIARIEAEGHRAAVNFALAASPGLSVLQTRFGIASHLPLGALREVQIELAFATWPRPMQAAAGPWLNERHSGGGFAREVLSHFIFVLQRVLGPAKVQAHRVAYPDDGITAETALRAELLAGGVPVRIDGRIGNDERADYNRMLWHADGGEIELTRWFGQIEQRLHEGTRLEDDPEAVRNASQVDQLKQWEAMIEGRSHSLPGFAEALAVQETIERLLLP
ncbi:Gfo/Idh/MocA family oxidoreductase [Paucibacter sp. R3-3]|uniref:Gfo/Idh/MocA family oxidoreductase n=1 Tax=Roseateles agri TaxID=3098619 RepID=A0ABU5DD19_9BURK|nr:Gfo/Idh/MocA family oxidoreductase [Paucibacter sp. R3-3]MDY0744176.1 Gfo/Idh/MocA family oxidoreductase [Paucibacter sp. R3-3]